MYYALSLIATIIYRTDAMAMEQMQNSSSGVYEEEENFIKDIELLQNVLYLFICFIYLCFIYSMEST